MYIALFIDSTRRVYVTVGCLSIRPSVCPIDRQQQRVCCTAPALVHLQPALSSKCGQRHVESRGTRIGSTRTCYVVRRCDAAVAAVPPQFNTDIEQCSVYSIDTQTISSNFVPASRAICRDRVKSMTPINISRAVSGVARRCQSGAWIVTIPTQL